MLGNHLCMRIHDVIPLAAIKSSALCIALVMWSTHGASPSSGLPCGISSMQGLLSASWLRPACSFGSLVVVLNRVVRLFAVGVVGVDVGVRRCATFFCLSHFVCKIIHIIRR